MYIPVVMERPQAIRHPGFEEGVSSYGQAIIPRQDVRNDSIPALQGTTSKTIYIYFLGYNVREKEQGATINEAQTYARW